MKTNIKLTTLVIAIIVTTASLFTSKKATAIYEPPKKYKAVSCYFYEEGIILVIGTHCITGTNTCIENPCE